MKYFFLKLLICSGFVVLYLWAYKIGYKSGYEAGRQDLYMKISGMKAGCPGWIVITGITETSINSGCIAQGGKL